MDQIAGRGDQLARRLDSPEGRGRPLPQYGHPRDGGTDQSARRADPRAHRARSIGSGLDELEDPELCAQLRAENWPRRGVSWLELTARQRPFGTWRLRRVPHLFTEFAGHLFQPLLLGAPFRSMRALLCAVQPFLQVTTVESSVRLIQPSSSSRRPLH